jgi:ABC-type nickel/cobalt efflux system permease component RcnA
MSFTPYTLALSDLVTVSGTLLLVAIALWLFARAWCAWFDRPQHTSAHRRAQPAHIDEPVDAARIIHALRRSPDLGEAYREIGYPIDHEDARAARQRFFATAARLNLERGSLETTDPASL